MAMFCNSASNKFCNKRNTIGVWCTQCKMTVYCSNYCKRNDALSHKGICFTNKSERRKAFLQTVKNGNFQPPINLCKTYIVPDKKKHRAAICLHDKPNKTVCLFCPSSSWPINIKYGNDFSYALCSECLRLKRYVCRKTLYDSFDCPGITFQECFILFLMDFPTRDIVFYIISVLRKWECDGCSYGRKEVESYLGPVVNRTWISCDCEKDDKPHL